MKCFKFSLRTRPKNCRIFTVFIVVYTILKYEMFQVAEEELFDLDRKTVEFLQFLMRIA
jgi:hypothetical protein